MKKSFLVALVTASAVALSSVAPVDAAQIGPIDQNKCKVTFTTAEKSYLDGLLRDVEAQLDSNFDRDINLSFEAAYPGAREVGNDFVDAFQHQLTGHKTQSAFNEALNNLASQPYERRLQNIGMSEVSAAVYLIFRANGAYGAGLQGRNDKFEPVDWDDVYAEATAKEADFDENLGGIILLLLFGFTGILDDEARMESFYKTFKKTKTGKVFETLNPYISAHADAQEACLGGGNVTISYPTSGTSKPAPSKPAPSKPAPSKPAPAKPAPEKPSNNTTDNQSTPANENKPSIAGIVIGVIAAILAIVGIAAVAAPQLGIQIPGLR